MEDDSVLVRDLLAGDERAFARFFEGYFPRIYRFALSRLNRDEQSAAEVTQATLTKVLRHLEKFRGDSSLFTWSCQICRNEIADSLRAQRRHASRVVPIDDRPELREALEAIGAPEFTQPAESLSRDQTRQLVRSVLDRLPDHYGDALEWKYVEGASVMEIGSRLGISHAAAQSLLQRARPAFRLALESVFGAEASDLLAELGT